MITGSRVTQRSMSTATMQGLNAQLAKNQRLQEQLSSGKAITKPSDDPAAVQATMQLRSQKAMDTQYLRNIDDAEGRLNLADGALTDLTSQIRRAQEVLVRSRNAVVNGESATAIRAELEEIGKSVVDTYNTQWLGRPIFAGTAQGSTAVNTDDRTYTGNDQPTVARVSRNVELRVDVGGRAAGADVLPGLLERAATNVTDDPASTAADLDELASVLSTVLRALGDVGARGAQLQTTRANVTDEQLDYTTRISEKEDVDLPKTIIDLQSSQTAYQAALHASAKIMQTSLLDFLR